MQALQVINKVLAVVNVTVASGFLILALTGPVGEGSTIAGWASAMLAWAIVFKLTK